MDVFKIITPLIYAILILVWAIILIFYVRKLNSLKGSDKFLRILLIILAIDAFRTLFESVYFGFSYASFYELLPTVVYDYLTQPEAVLVPKTINLFASFLVVFIIIQKWIPEESTRLETFSQLLSERTKVLEASKEKLKNEVDLARESEKRYRRATINSPFPIMIHAEDGEVLMINDSWTKITGYQFEDVNTVQKWVEIAYEDKANEILSIITKTYNIDEVVQNGEFQIKTKSGESRIWDFSSAPLDVMPDGRKLIISTAVDVTEQRKALKKLKSRELQLQSVFEAADKVAFITTTFDGETSKITSFSIGAEKIFGYKASEVLGMPIAHLHLAEDVMKFSALQDVLRKNKTGISGESTLIRKTGEHFPALFSLYPLLNETNEVFASLGVSIDISEIKKVEAELKTQNKQLQDFYEVTIDREMRILELKKEVNKLTIQSGSEAKYEIPK